MSVVRFVTAVESTEKPQNDSVETKYVECPPNDDDDTLMALDESSVS